MTEKQYGIVPVQTGGMFFDVERFNHVQRVAAMLAKAAMWPEAIRSVGDVAIVMNYAERLRADPFVIAQNIHIIHGNPGFSGALVGALVNQSGKYSEPLQYLWVDENDNEITRGKVINSSKPDGRGCVCWTRDAKSGKMVDSPKVSWGIIHAEGWYNKNGSKWKTMPELMFRYRSTAWFARANCPEVMLGMQTVEELRDVVEMSPGRNGHYKPVDETAANLTAAIESESTTSGTVAQEAGFAPEDRTAINPNEFGHDKPYPEIPEKLHTTRPYPDEVIPANEVPEKEGEKSADEFAPPYQMRNDAEWKSEWINLKEPGFVTYFWKNKATIEQLSKEKARLIREAWYRKVKKAPYPLDPAKPPEIKNTEVSDETKGDGRLTDLSTESGQWALLVDVLTKYPDQRYVDQAINECGFNPDNGFPNSLPDLQKVKEAADAIIQEVKEMEANNG